MPPQFNLSENPSQTYLEVWILGYSIAHQVTLSLSTLQGAPFTKLCMNVALDGQYCLLMEIHRAYSPVCSNFKCT